VDDSIVRGVTAGRIVSLLRKAGALEVHYRVTCPPFRYTCYYGTDISNPASLLANQVVPEGIAAHIGADSVGFLSLCGLLEVVNQQRGNADCCTACFTGKYLVDPPAEIAEDIYARPVQK